MGPRFSPLLSALGALSFLCAAGQAAAHAIVIAALPAVNATVSGAALPIELRFNSRIDQERSRLTLVRPDGTSSVLPLAPATAPDRLITKASGLPAGAYRLHWQVLSVDGHITRGDIPFKVSE